jgi:hypothetical protein
MHFLAFHIVLFLFYFVVTKDDEGKIEKVAIRRFNITCMKTKCEGESAV